jgi:hypothetical protein
MMPLAIFVWTLKDLFGVIIWGLCLILILVLLGLWGWVKLMELLERVYNWFKRRKKS